MSGRKKRPDRYDVRELLKVISTRLYVRALWVVSGWYVGIFGRFAAPF